MRRILKFMIMADVSFVFASALLAPLYAVFAENIGASIFLTSGAWAVYSMVTGTLIIITGKIENFMDKKRMIFLSYCIQTIAFFGYFLTNEVWQLFVIQALLGVASAINVPAWCALYSKNLSDNKETEDWSSYQGMSNIATGIGALAGGVVVSFWGFKPLFLIMSGFGIIGILLTILMMRRGPMDMLDCKGCKAKHLCTRYA